MRWVAGFGVLGATALIVVGACNGDDDAVTGDGAAGPGGAGGDLVVCPCKCWGMYQWWSETEPGVLTHHQVKCEHHYRCGNDDSGRICNDSDNCTDTTICIDGLGCWDACANVEDCYDFCRAAFGTPAFCDGAFEPGVVTAELVCSGAGGAGGVAEGCPSDAPPLSGSACAPDGELCPYEPTCCRCSNLGECSAWECANPSLNSVFCQLMTPGGQCQPLSEEYHCDFCDDGVPKRFICDTDTAQSAEVVIATCGVGP